MKLLISRFHCSEGMPKKGIHTNKELIKKQQQKTLLNSAISEMGQLQKLQL